jgi:hypothetical protein
MDHAPFFELDLQPVYGFQAALAELAGLAELAPGPLVVQALDIKHSRRQVAATEIKRSQPYDGYGCQEKQ